MAKRKINPIHETSNEARELARRLIDEAVFASIAVLEPETGIPIVSRIGVAVDFAGNLVFLASQISNHTKALFRDTRASIMVGEPGKGDPLAHPRIALIGNIEKINRTSNERDLLRDPYLVSHPKARPSYLKQKTSRRPDYIVAANICHANTSRAKKDTVNINVRAMKCLKPISITNA